MDHFYTFTAMAAASVITAALVLWRMEAGASGRLRMFAARRGYGYTRKDGGRTMRLLDGGFSAGGVFSYGWVRDFVHDSDTSVFRLNVVKSGARGVKQIMPSYGMLGDAPAGGPLVVETDDAHVLTAHVPGGTGGHTDDPRARRLAAYLPDNPAPRPLVAMFSDGRWFVSMIAVRPFEPSGEMFAYLLGLAENVFRDTGEHAA